MRSSSDAEDVLADVIDQVEEIEDSLETDSGQFRLGHESATAKVLAVLYGELEALRAAQTAPDDGREEP